jgi:hypothetical protein
MSDVSNVKRLVLVDNRVPFYTGFIMSLQTDVFYVPIIYSKDTYASVLRWILTYDCSFSSVAYIGRCENSSLYNFMRNEPYVSVRYVRDTDPELETWKGFMDFISAIPGIQTFDFLNSDLYSYTGWQYIFNGLQEKTGITIRASVDKTGNDTQGGNWFLELGDVDAKQIYFTDTLLDYPFIV